MICRVDQSEANIWWSQNCDDVGRPAITCEKELFLSKMYFPSYIRYGCTIKWHGMGCCKLMQLFNFLILRINCPAFNLVIQVNSIHLVSFLTRLIVIVIKKSIVWRQGKLQQRGLIQKKIQKKREPELCSTFSEAKPAGGYDSLRTDDAIALGPWKANCHNVGAITCEILYCHLFYSSRYRVLY